MDNSGWNNNQNQQGGWNQQNQNGWNSGYQQAPPPPPVQRQPVFYQGVLNRQLLKEESKALFRNSYWNTFLACLLPTVVAGAIGAIVPPIGTIASWLFTPALAVGGITLLLKIVRGRRDATAGDVFSIFNNNFGNVFGACFTTSLFIALWSLLLIVPGIYKSYCWAMVYHILADNPGMSGTEARALSEQMMEGHKMEYFILHLSFIGWWLLSVCTFGILALFYVEPWVATTTADYYDNLKMLYEAKQQQQTYAGYDQNQGLDNNSGIDQF